MLDVRPDATDNVFKDALISLDVTNCWHVVARRAVLVTGARPLGAVLLCMCVLAGHMCCQGHRLMTRRHRYVTTMVNCSCIVRHACVRT